MRRDLGIAALLAAALAFTYVIVVQVPYAVTDDWRYLATMLQGNGWSKDSVASGRPLLAVLVYLGFDPISHHGELRWLRLIAIAGAALVAFLLYRAAARAGWARWKGAVLSVLVCTTPPFQVLVSWAITFSFLYSVALAIAAYRVCQLAREARAHRRWLLAIGAVALLVAAGTIYQVTLMFFVVPLALDLFRPEAEDEPGRVRHLLFAGAILAAGMIVCFVLYKAGTMLLPRSVPPARAALAGDLVHKIAWFVKDPLQSAFHVWRIVPTDRLAATVALLISTGLVLYFPGPPRARLAQLGVAAGLLVVAYAPNLIAGESWGAYRTQIVLTSLVVLYAFFALHGFARLLPARATHAVLLIVLLLGAELAALSAKRNVRIYYAEPQALEESVMRAQLLGADLTSLRTLHVVAAPFKDNIPGFVRYDEFGIPSTSQPWAVGTMAWVLSREILGRPPYFGILPTRAKVAPPLHWGEHAIVMRGLYRWAARR